MTKRKLFIINNKRKIQKCNTPICSSPDSPIDGNISPVIHNDII